MTLPIGMVEMISPARLRGEAGCPLLRELGRVMRLVIRVIVAQVMSVLGPGRVRQSAGRGAGSWSTRSAPTGIPPPTTTPTRKKVRELVKAKAKGQEIAAAEEPPKARSRPRYKKTAP